MASSRPASASRMHQLRPSRMSSPSSVNSGTSSSTCALLELPSEIQLAVFEGLEAPLDVLNLGRCCRGLHALARSDEVWRERISSTLERHLKTSGSPLEQPCRCWRTDDDLYARYVQALLRPAGSYLGWWASTQAYRGRLVRISVQQVPQSSTLTIVGEEVTAVNAYDIIEARAGSKDYPRRWKPAAARWQNVGEVSYRLPSHHHSPYAGLSVDILHPILRYTPLFSFHPALGFTLSASFSDVTDAEYPNPASPRSPRPTPITATIDYALRRKVQDVSEHSEREPSRYARERGPSFPSRQSYAAGLLRKVLPLGQGPRDASPAQVEDDDDDSNTDTHLVRDMLTWPAFALKARHPSSHINQAEPSTSAQAINSPSQSPPRQQQETGQPQPHAPMYLANNAGGNQLFRAFLEGIGAVLPPQMPNALLDDAEELDMHEYFYPLDRCPLPGDSAGLNKRPNAAGKSSFGSANTAPVLAKSLEGLWVGSYSSHGMEFGIINVRHAWMRREDETDESSIIERFYIDSDHGVPNIDPSIALRSGRAGSSGCRRECRTIIELVKVTGDINVPAGQVTWCALLPQCEEEFVDPNPDEAGARAGFQQVTPREQDIDTVEVPTVLRKDWEEWSDAPPHTAEEHDHLHNPPRWDEGSLEGAGRIAFTGFTDTQFINAVVTFVREDDGNVDEIRVKWFDMNKVSCFRRCRIGR